MDFKTFRDYLIAGMSLARKHLHIFLIGFVLSEYFLLGAVLPPESPITRLILFLLVFPYIGFSLTIPLFLTRSQKGEKDTFHSFFSETLSSLKRSFLQLILVMFLTGLLFTALLFSVVLLTKLANIPYTTLTNASFQGINSGYIFFVLFSTGITILFSFAAIFFSLEKDSLITAVKKGFQALKHYSRFTLWIFAFTVVVSILVKMLTVFLPFRDILYSLLLTYLSYVITTTIVIFYQKTVIKKVKGVL